EILDETIFRNILLAHRRADAVGRNRIDPNALGRELHGDGAGEIQHAGFRGGVGGRLLASPVTGGGSDVDDFSLALLIDHHLRGGAGAVPDAAQADVHHPVPLLFADVEDRLVIGPGRVVHQNIDAAELLDHGLNHAVHRRRGGNVAHDRDRFTGIFRIDRVGDAAAAPRVQVDNGDLRALFDKQFADILADVASRAGDDGDLI